MPQLQALGPASSPARQNLLFLPARAPESPQRAQRQSRKQCCYVPPNIPKPFATCCFFHSTGPCIERCGRSRYYYPAPKPPLPHTARLPLTSLPLTHRLPSNPTGLLPPAPHPLFLFVPQWYAACCPVIHTGTLSRSVSRKKHPPPTHAHLQRNNPYTPTRLLRHTHRPPPHSYCSI